MDPNTVVLEISSDEEVGWDDHDGRGFTDCGDDHNWIAELLDEVNRDDCDYDCGYEDGGYDSDEVVVVSDVFPSKKPRKKLKSKSSSLIDLDDDCVVLDHDPDKPVEVRNGKPIDRDEDDDSDDLLVVSEKGQVACRDYPHPRHLCIKFPFSSTPTQSHCHQCYCYVCDSLAPCVYWGKGGATLDHSLATDKDEFWKHERKNSKNPPCPFVTPPMAKTPTRVGPLTSNFRPPNIISRGPFSLPRNKFPYFFKANKRGNLNNLFHKPVFKTSSYNYRNPTRPTDGILSGSSQSNMVSEPVFPPLTQFDFSPNFNSPVNIPVSGPSFVDKDISETGQQPAAEGMVSTNGPTNASVSTGFVDNWYLDNQLCELGSMDIPDPFELNEFSPEPTFVDTGTIFNDF